MKRFLTFILVFFIAEITFSQTILMEENVTEDTIPKEFGPNLKKFSHIYFGFGFVTGPVEGQGARLSYWNSTDFNVGFRHKRKVIGFYDVGFDLFYGLTSFNISQDSGKTFPTSELYDREKINFSHLGLNIFNRINFGRRGNIIRNYIDIGAYGQFEFVTKHIFFRELPSPNVYNANIMRVANRGLEYANQFNYGLQARLGFRRFALFGKYRLSDIIDPSFGFPEMPRFIFGLQLGIHS